MNIRWNIGPTKEQGFDCLHESIKSVQKLYPNHDYHVFFNQIDKDKLKHLPNVEVHNQHDYLDTFPIKPLNGYQVHWKLYPPKLDINKHELTIDNDIILFNHVKEIDLFLESDSHTLLYQGLNNLHGQFKNMIPQGIRINSGIYGTPAGFDIVEKMNKINTWGDKFDEQGLIADTLLRNNYFIIPLTSVPIIEPNFNLKSLTHDLCCGYHFVGLNYSKHHKAWATYQQIKQKQIKQFKQL